MPTTEVCRKHGLSQGTFYKYKSKYGGMEVSDVARMRSLTEREIHLRNGSKLLRQTEPPLRAVSGAYIFNLSKMCCDCTVIRVAQFGPKWANGGGPLWATPYKSLKNNNKTFTHKNDLSKNRGIAK